MSDAKRRTVESIQSVVLAVAEMQDIADAALAAALDDRWEEADSYLQQLSSKQESVGHMAASSGVAN
jgi:hypothetical protein